MPKARSYFTRLRFATAAVSAVLLNLGAFGISARSVCAPGFWCHGCSWATFACPVGVIAYGSAVHAVPILAIGTVLAIGAICGRLVCSFICPFGLLQDLLHKIPSPKITLPRFVRYGKYAALVLLVLLLPWWVGFKPSGYLTMNKPLIEKHTISDVKVKITVNNPGTEPVTSPQFDVRYNALDNGEELFKHRQEFTGVTIPPGKTMALPEFIIPNMLAQANVAVETPQSAVEQKTPYSLYYCKLCPAGTLTATIPSYFKPGNRSVVERMQDHWLKLTILGFFLVLMVLSSRPFCRLFCPLGACYALATPLAVTGMKLENALCVSCQACSRACPVDLDVTREVGSPECIACGDCIQVCPKQGIVRTIGIIRS